MARLHNRGAEGGSVLQGIDWGTNPSGSSGMSLETTIVKGSRGSYKCTVSGGGARYVLTPFVTADNTNTKYAKIDWYLGVDGFGSNFPGILGFTNAAGTNNALVRFQSQPGLDNLVLVNHAGTTVVTGPTVTTGQWYRIEINFIYNAGGSTSELIVDGVSYGSGTTGDSAGSNHASTILWGANMSGSGETAAEMYFDNIIVNDSTGSSENSWIGDQRLLQAHPTAMGDAVVDNDASPYLWQTSGGGVQSGDLTNWNRVDENPPDDATTHSRAALTQHYLDIYAVENRTTIGHMAATDEITFLNVNGRMGGNGTTDRYFRYFFQYASAGTGSTYSGDLNAKANSYFTGDVNNLAGALLHPVHPSGKVGSDLDAMEIGVYKNDGTSRTVFVSALWLEFTYKVPPPAISVRLRALLGVGH